MSTIHLRKFFQRTDPLRTNLLIFRFGIVITGFWGVIPDLSNLLSLIQASYPGFNLGIRFGPVSGITNYH